LLHEREMPLVLASIARFGKIITGVDRAVLLEPNNIDPRTFQLATRLCAKELEPDDVGYVVTCSLVNQGTVAVHNLAKIKPSTLKKTYG
jgi:hypothetical protein